MIAINAGWRRDLLPHHRLMASVQFDKNLFYPVAEATYGLVIKGHEPHPPGSDVFVGRLFDDRHRPRRSKILSDYEAVDNVDEMTEQLRRFLLGLPVTRNIPRTQTVTGINDIADFSPEQYLPDAPISVDPTSRAVGTVAAGLMVAARGARFPLTVETAVFPLSRFASVIPATVTTIKGYRPGQTPLVSATAKDNGIAAWLDIPTDDCAEHCFTVSLIHNTKPCQAFWHPYRFAGLKGKVMILKPEEALLTDPDAIVYLCESVTAFNAWRYHYARSPRYVDLAVQLPVREDGSPDIRIMGEAVRQRLQLEGAYTQ